MAQPSIASYFSSRKRPATDDVQLKSRKVIILDKTCNIKTPTKKTSTVTENDHNNLVTFLKKGFLSPNKLRVQKPEHSKLDLNDEKSVETNAGQSSVIQVPDTVGARSSYPLVKISSTAEKSTSSTTLDTLKSKLNSHPNVGDFTKRVQAFQQKVNAVKNKKVIAQTSSKISIHDSPTLKKFHSVEIEVLSPTKRGYATECIKKIIPKLNLAESASISSPSKRSCDPAFKSFGQLAQPERKALDLPIKFRALLETFRAIDVISATLFNRNEKITFKRLKIAVQRMTKKNFTESDLGKIKTMYPEAFDFSIEKFRNFGSESKAETYQLIIMPKYMDEHGSQSGGKNVNDKSKTTKLLTSRYKIFSKRLLDHVKNDHECYLQSFDPPIIVDSNSIVRWHPEFDLNNCKDIIAADLPKPPQQAILSSAQDVLTTARNLFAKDPPENQCQPSSSVDGTRVENLVTTKTSTTTVAPVNARIRSLLEKIKQKETSRAIELMTKKSSTDAFEEYASHLPDMIRHIKNIYITEKKNILLVETVVEKLLNSYKNSPTANKVDSILKGLTKRFPDTFSIQLVNKKSYLRVMRHEDINEVIKKCCTLPS